MREPNRLGAVPIARNSRASRSAGLEEAGRPFTFLCL